MQPTALSFSEILKFNPYHDSLGRFASSGGAASFTYKPGASTAHSKAIEREKAKAGEDTDTGKGFKGTLYHGSPNTDIKEFDMSRAGKNTSSGEKLLFFTDSKQMADDFSYERLDGSSKFFQKRGKKGRVYEVDVEMKNPLDFRKLSDKDIDNILKLDSDGLLTKDTVKQMAGKNHQLLKTSLDLRAERLKELGYDGLIAGTGKAGHNSLEYAVVDSKQAKIRKSDDMAKSFLDIFKFNENHDELGRFAPSNGGGALKMTNNITGYSQGQTDSVMTAEIDGKVAGTLSYSEYGDEPYINMIETNPEYRGQGVATKMLQNLQAMYEGKNINAGMLTEDGAKLFEKVSEKVPNKEYSETKSKLDSLKAELKRFESLTDEENANLSQKDGDRWNELYDLISEGTNKLSRMREFDVHIKKSDSEVTNMAKSDFHIVKSDDEKRLVFGWALVSATSDGQQIIDHQGDIVDQDELEEGAYEYVLNFRDAGEEHIGTLRKKARMVESVVFTEEKLQAMGIPAGTVPYGWWIGFYVDDDRTWEKIKSGHYKMFSIEGRAIREPVNEPVGKSEHEPVAKTFSELIEKFNPYHDRLGRFTSGNNAASMTIRTSSKLWQNAADKAIAREKERTASAGDSSGGKKDPKPMTEEEYLRSKGVGDASSGWVLDKLRSNRQIRTQRGKERFDREYEKAEREYQEKREKAKQEYREKVKSGELRDKTRIERTIERANGNPDNPSVQAARRMAEKRGIDWKTGKPLQKSYIAKSFSDLMKFNPYHDRLGRFTTGGGFGVSSSMYTGNLDTKAVTFSANPDTRAGAMAIARRGGVVPRAYSDDDIKIPPKATTAKKPKPDTKKPETEPENKMYPKKLAGVERGEEMSFEEADHGTTNPNFSQGGGYYRNCQTCVVANEARRRGYDVTARPKDTPEAMEISHATNKAWIDPKTGTHPKYIVDDNANTPKKAKQFLEDNIQSGNRYTMEFAWKGRGNSGHIINVFRDSDGGLKLYDPQSGKQYSGNDVDGYLSRIKLKTSIYGIKVNIPIKVLRVDNMEFNTEMVDKILVKGAA